MLEEGVERKAILRKRGRECGRCSMCCKLVGVGKPGEDFQKPQGKWCPHCTIPGCGIYDERPNACREYQCLWLRGLFGEDDRPDRSKFLVHLEQSVGDHIWDSGGQTILKDAPVWTIYYARENAMTTTASGRVIAELKKMTIRSVEDGEWHGPFAICLIPPKPAKRLIWIPGKTQGFVPVLRPEEVPK